MWGCSWNTFSRDEIHLEYDKNAKSFQLQLTKERRQPPNDEILDERIMANLLPDFISGYANKETNLHNQSEGFLSRAVSALSDQSKC